MRWSLTRYASRTTNIQPEIMAIRSIFLSSFVIAIIADAFATPLIAVTLIVKNLLTVVIYFSHFPIESE